MNTDAPTSPVPPAPADPVVKAAVAKAVAKKKPAKVVRKGKASADDIGKKVAAKLQEALADENADDADADADEPTVMPSRELDGTELGGATTKKKYAGVAKWQMRGYDSKDEAEALGFYKKGDTCDHCGKTFERKYPKFLHYDKKGDTSCSGKLKRPARQQGKTAVKIDDWVKKVGQALVMLGEADESYTFTAKDFMAWLLSNGSHSKADDIKAACENHLFLKTAIKKGIDEAPDVKLMGYAMLPDGTTSEHYETAESISFARYLADNRTYCEDDAWGFIIKTAEAAGIDFEH